MIAIIQHVPYESPGNILTWLTDNNIAFQLVDVYKNDPLPALEAINGLIVMGGSMNVYEEKQYPWLTAEKEFIRRCIVHQKKVFGICMGAQLIAAAMGAKVKRNAALEIGWYPVTTLDVKLPKKLQGVFPAEFTTFHWHGDMFDFPAGSRSFASSEACPNQGFTMGKNVLAMQFHPEITGEGVEDLIVNDTDDLFTESVFVQTVEEIRQGKTNINNNRKILFDLLVSFFSQELCPYTFPPLRAAHSSTLSPQHLL